jgi:type I restriction-modification system DNA methylase subunit
MEKSKQDNQVVSRQRVKDHGEVFTQEKEVNAMLDLVRNETERIESRFLEPACGTGNFLVPVLEESLPSSKKGMGQVRAILNEWH